MNDRGTRRLGCYSHFVYAIRAGCLSQALQELIQSDVWWPASFSFFFFFALMLSEAPFRVAEGFFSCVWRHGGLVPLLKDT